MKKLLLALIFLTSLPSFASPVEPSPFRSADPDALDGKRGWMLKAGYNRQDETNWLELGVGRINLLSARSSGTTFIAGAAAFTFGADLGFDTSLIVAPRLGIEVHATALGARVSYAYFMQDANETGIITLEGGLCIVSRFYVYGGYNFVNGNQDSPVIPKGPRFSIGFNFPFGLRAVPPTKRIGE
ncbi:MAG TPA: hypothetical protein VK826_15740 [Bacteroidia bacterium]|nr:hypothetical protein [Bacteroidia bacterium]